MANPFKRASKAQLKLRMALIGPAGSGKTYSALNIGQHLGEKIAVVDTEHGSASKYAGLFAFDVLELESFHPQMYIDAISAAEQAGYDVLIIDSLSHAWMGKDGALELVDRAAKRSPSGNSFAAWRDVTPLHNKLIEAMLAAKLHLIVTMRSKMEYVQDKDDKGRTVIRKVGLQPVQRDGLEYEFDVVADMDTDNNFVVGKTRCPALAGAVVARPGKEVADTLLAWLTDGVPPAQPLPSAPRPASDPAPQQRPAAPATAQPAPAPQRQPQTQPAAPRQAQPASQSGNGQGNGQVGDPRAISIRFGKYAGMTLGQIAATDMGYAKWLADNAQQTDVREAAKAIIAATPQAQPTQQGPTQQQIARLMAIAHDGNIAKETIQAYMQQHYGIDSLKQLTREQYDEVCEWLQRRRAARALPTCSPAMD